MKKEGEFFDKTCSPPDFPSQAILKGIAILVYSDKNMEKYCTPSNKCY